MRRRSRRWTGVDYGRSVGRGILGTDRVDARSRAPAHSLVDRRRGGRTATGHRRTPGHRQGLHPVVLRDVGLAAALRALAESRHLRITETPADRYSDVVESTAYMLVAHCSEAGPSTVAARADQSTLVVDVEIDGRPELLGEIAYRITTLVEGSLTSDFRNGRTRRTLMRPLQPRLARSKPVPGGAADRDLDGPVEFLGGAPSY